MNYYMKGKYQEKNQQINIEKKNRLVINTPQARPWDQSDGTLSPSSPLKIGRLHGVSKLLSPAKLRKVVREQSMNEDIPLSPLYQNAKNGSSSDNVFNVTQTTSFKPGATFNG